MGKLQTEYILHYLNTDDSGEITAEVEVPPNAIWFSGHFPSAPILPGIAQVAIVADVIRQSSKFPVSVSGVKRVRFKQVIRPGDCLKIKASPSAKNRQHIAFRIFLGDEVATTGTICLKG